jgi:hypothetical protein
MNDCRTTVESIEEGKHDVEHGDFHMDGEFCGMGEGNRNDEALTPAELREALEGEK